MSRFFSVLSQERWLRVPVLCWIFTLGVGLRILNLVSEKSIWGDEWYSIRLAALSWHDLFFVEIFADNHPTTFPIFNKIWASVFGNSELSFRAASTVLSSGVVLLTYPLATKLFDRRAGLLAVFFVSISPYFLQLSREMRSYNLLTFTSMVATVSFLKVLDAPQKRIWRWLFVAFSLISIYTEHFAWFWFFSVTVYAIFLCLFKRVHYELILRPFLIILFLSAGSVALIIFQSLNAEDIFDAGKLSMYREFLIILKKVVGVYWRFICGPVFSMLTTERVLGLVRTSVAFWVSFGLLLTSLAVGLRGGVALVRKDKALFFFGLMLLVFPTAFLASFYPIRLEARYFCWAVPFFLSFLAFSCVAIRRRGIALLFALFFSVCSLVADIHMIRLRTDPIHKEDYRGMLLHVFSRSGFRDAIAGAGPLTHYYHDKIGVRPKGDYFINLDQAIESAKMRAYDRIWTMHYIDMDPEVNERILATHDKRLNALGYYRLGGLIRFGGADALTAVQMYEKKDRDY